MLAAQGSYEGGEAWLLQVVGFLPQQLKKAYLEAVLRAPDLIEQESPPRWFLKHEKGEVYAGAKRLVAYWEKRIEVFGHGDAFKPLHEVAERLSAVEHLGCLPPDREGSPAYFLNCTKLPHWEKRELLKRLFVWMQMIAYGDASRTLGVVGIVVTGQNFGQSEVDSCLDSCFDILDVFPVTFKCFHACLLSSNTRVPLRSNPDMAKYASRCKVMVAHTHVVDSVPDLELKLRNFGLDISSFLEEYNDSLSIVEGDRKPEVSLANASCNLLQESTATDQEALRQLDEAIGMLPAVEKLCYLAAVRIVPHLVHIESNPLKYLKFAKYDAWSAASRLAAYWSKRVELFGEGAFRPLAICQGSALNEEDIGHIFAGWLSVMPKDAYGCINLCGQPHRRVNGSPESRLRCTFYFFHIICEFASPTEGVSFVVVLGKSASSGANVDTHFMKAVDVILQCFPSTIHTTHIVNCPTGLGQRIFYDSFLPLVLRFFGGLLSKKILLHVGEKSEILRKLAVHGLLPANLPESAGGKVSRRDHVQWCTERGELESARYGLSCLESVPSLMNRYGIQDAAVSLLLRAAQVHSLNELRAIDESTLGPTGSSFVVDTQRRHIKGADTSTSTTDIVARSALFSPNQNQEPGHSSIDDIIATIPPQEKKGYMKALQAFPGLVERESLPAKFITCEGMNLPRAARRLTDYWDVRCRMFGERCYKPLNQTGEGALDRKDVAALSSGYLMSLPDDTSGRPVLFCDGSRLCGSSSDSRLRTTFYMFSILSENSLAQSQGAILIYAANDPSFDRAYRECLQIILPVLPLVINTVHILLLRHDESESDEDVLKIMDPELLTLFRDVAKHKALIHPASSRSLWAHRLSPYGIAAAGIPKSHGGNFGVDNFADWQETRLRYEWDLPPSANIERDHVVYDFSGVQQLRDLTEDEQKERKRRLNVLHSRKKRERQRIRVEVLEEQVAGLRSMKVDAMKLQLKLSDLVLQAEELVERYHGDNPMKMI